MYCIHDYQSLLHSRLYIRSPRQSLRGYSVNILFMDTVGFGIVYRTAVKSVRCYYVEQNITVVVHSINI